MALDFPLQFKRQYAAPLDIDSIFETRTALESYLNSKLKYPGMVASVIQEEGKLYILNKTMTAWVSTEYKMPTELLDKIKTIIRDGDGDLVLHDDGTYKKIIQVNSNWLEENTSSPAYIKNRPSIYNQDEITAAFDIFMSILDNNYSTKSELAALPIYMANNKEILAKFSTLNNSLYFDNKLIMTNYDIKNNSLTIPVDSIEDWFIALNINTLLDNKTISNFTESELVISGNMNIEVYDGTILLDTFTCNDVEKFDIGISKDIIVKSKGTGTIKFNYVSVERS